MPRKHGVVIRFTRIVVKGKEGTIFVSIFKGSWFDHSHFDLESNLKFVFFISSILVFVQVRIF